MPMITIGRFPIEHPRWVQTRQYLQMLTEGYDPDVVVKRDGSCLFVVTPKFNK